jgi:GNAT superfamily N-acetyltransferase
MIRSALPTDVETIAELIRALAEYEKLSHEATFSIGALRHALFGERPFAEVLLAERDGDIVGFALFFHNFSTFLAKPGIYLEDLFARPEHRGEGHGQELFRALARIAVERGCGRLEWAVLDWNEPSIGFYRALGARAMDEWTTFRLAADALVAVASDGS